MGSGEGQTMEMTENGVTEYKEWQTLGNDRQWDIWDNGEWHVTMNDLQWGITVNGKWHTMGISDKWWW